MLHKLTKWPLIAGLAMAAAGAALAQTTTPSSDNQALIDVLVKKGVITDQEAKEISAEVAQSQSSEDVETNHDLFIQRIVLSGRFQEQYVGLGTSIDGNPVHPVSTEHFILRRMYVGFLAQFQGGFSGNVVYDLANDSFDKALLEWKANPLFVLDGGFTKAPFGYEENQSSGDLRAIERSEITRYIDEPNNGRRLGAASYRTGLFASGTMDGFFYNVAVTDPERNEYSGDSTNTAILVNGLGGVGSTGTAATNKFAYYGTAGYGGSFGEGALKSTYKFGYEAGFLPDQGGPSTTIGIGKNIELNGGYVDYSISGFRVIAEYQTARDDSGVALNHDANPHGYYVQPSYKFTPQWEAVFQYSTVNSDGRGVALSDVIRSAPSGGTMNTSDEYYIGANYYIRGNDVKLQAGYIHGDSDNTVKGGPAKAETDGVRSQIQIQF